MATFADILGNQAGTSGRSMPNSTLSNTARPDAAITGLDPNAPLIAGTPAGSLWQPNTTPTGANLLNLLFGGQGNAGLTPEWLQQGFMLPSQATSALGLPNASSMTPLGQMPLFGLQPGQVGQAATGFLNQLNFNPSSAANDMFGQMMQMLGPQQAQQRQNLNEQLLAQGRLGSTGGGVQQTALENAIQQQNAGVAANALSQAQAYQNMLGNQAQGFLGQAGNLSNAQTSALQNLLGTGLASGTGFLGQLSGLFSNTVNSGQNYTLGQAAQAAANSGGGGFLKNLGGSLLGGVVGGVAGPVGGAIGNKIADLFS